MKTRLADHRPVYAVGVGWHPYQNPSETHYAVLGLQAIRAALVDAGVDWSDVEQSFIGTALLGMAPGRPMLKHLGAHGKPLLHVENASASGSAAFQIAVHHVAAGFGDLVLALGIDKRPPGGAARQADRYVSGLADHLIVPPAHFAMLAEDYLREHGQPRERLAEIAVKNHANAALNPNAQRQKPRTLDDVLNSRAIAGPLTALQCCPVGEGAAAVLLASAEAIKALGIASSRPVRIAAASAASERFGGSDREITAEVVGRALADAGLSAAGVDVAEFHDAFSVEEAFYAEASGLCPPGRYLPMLREGAFAICGKCAVSPSGGLIAMGHPIGPTGVGQIGELVLQLRAEAGERQHKNARVGLASMVGLGAVGYAHVLTRD